MYALSYHNDIRDLVVRIPTELVIADPRVWQLECNWVHVHA